MSFFRSSVWVVAWLTAASTIAQETVTYADRSRDDIATLNTLLRRRDVEREIGITPLQHQAILRSRYASRDLSEELTRQSPSLTRTQIETALHQINVTNVSAAANCLTGEQLLRLEQLRTQYQLFSLGPARLFAESLELTEEEEQKASELEAELTTELRELMWSLQHRVQRELVSSLTAEQLMKWRRCVGAEFQFTPVMPGLTPLRGLTNHHALPDPSPEYTHLRLMNRIDVQKELELIDDQLAAVTHGREEASRKLAASEKRLHLAIAEGKTDEVRRITAEVMEDQRQWGEAKAKVRQELLLPHQLERLDELVWQYRSIPEPVRIIAEAVGVGEPQRERLSLQASELCSLMTEELWGFHRTAQRRMLESLSLEHQIKWKKQLGEEFKFQSTTETFQILCYLR